MVAVGVVHNSCSRLEYMRDYRAKNKIRLTQYRRERYEEHPEYYRNYQEHTPELLLAAGEARRACLARASNDVVYRRALEVFDGLMLGDAGLVFRGKNAKFHLGLSGKRMGIPSEHLIAYLEHVKSVLEVLGVEAMEGYPKICKGFKKDGKPYEYCELWTRVSPFLTFEHVRWYSNLYSNGTAHSEVPEDVLTTPVSIAYWCMGDGSFGQGNGPSVKAFLCTQGFSIPSIEILEARLHTLGISTGRARGRAEKGSGIEITVLQGSIDNLMRMIDPYVVEPYRYKIIYRDPISASFLNLRDKVHLA